VIEHPDRSDGTADPAHANSSDVRDAPGVCGVSADPYDLERFVRAQDAGTHDAALAELRRGRKTSHWMWFVFPQLAGLGHSAMSRRYAITSIDEAVAHLRHPVLGPRLRTAAATLTALDASRADDVLGRVDAQKLHSASTLFHRAAPADPVFAAVLDRFFDGVPDASTDRLLQPGRPAAR